MRRAVMRVLVAVEIGLIVAYLVCFALPRLVPGAAAILLMPTERMSVLIGDASAAFLIQFGMVAGVAAVVAIATIARRTTALSNAGRDAFATVAPWLVVGCGISHMTSTAEIALRWTGVLLVLFWVWLATRFSPFPQVVQRLVIVALILVAGWILLRGPLGGYLDLAAVAIGLLILFA